MWVCAFEDDPVWKNVPVVIKWRSVMTVSKLFPWLKDGVCAAPFAAIAASLIYVVLAPSAAAQVVLSEVMYDPIGGNTNEFVELHNAGTNAVDVGGWRFTDGITYTFPTPTEMDAGAYLVVAVNRAAFAALYPDVTNLAPGVYSGQLSNQGEKLALADAVGTPVYSVTYNNKEPWPLAAAGLGSSLVLVDPYVSADNPSNWVASAQLNGSPGRPDRFFVRDVVINEVLAHTDPPQEDVVELRNLTTNAVSLAGWYLSDDNTVRKKYRFPAGSLIPPQGYLVVYQYQMTNSVIPFSLSSKGDGIFLSEADDADKIIRYVDQYQYEPSQNGFSFGRYPDGTGEFTTLAAPTFGVSSPASVEAFRTGTGARNASPKIGPVVINEIMYHPADSNALGRMPVEYVELLNVSGAPVALFDAQNPADTWSLSGGISYDFPTNLTMRPGQFLLVIATNAVEEFRLSYGLSTNVVILGPWLKSLNNSGDTIRLRANDQDPLDGYVFRYVVDEVSYSDQLPWPLAADGLGGSLERSDSRAFGNTADNWHSLPGAVTPGATNSVFVPPGAVIISEIMAVNRSTLQDEDGDFSDWIELCNTTAQAVSLKGWHLTDQADKPTLWTFPNVSIPAHGQLVVFASQKNCTDPLAELHTNFGLDAAGEYLALFRDDLVLECAFDPAFPPQSADVSYGIEAAGTRTMVPIEFGTAGRYLVPTNAAQLASDWNNRTFNASGWKPAGNGIGYDNSPDYLPLIQTDLNAEMFNKQGSAFVRYPFVLDDSVSVAQILLRLKFEDGFAAWLNGTLVASNNAPASLAWNSANAANRSDTLAVVFQDFNLNAFAHLLVDGTNVLAFQVINSGTNSSDLLLMSELHLTWAASTGTVAQTAGYLYPATPGTVNGKALPGIAPVPALSNPGGLFTGTLSVTVTCANVQAAIRYTLNGSEPTTNSPLYSAPLAITTDTELIARAFVPGLVQSPVTSAVYRRTFLGINELLADNVYSTPEINDFTDFGDWIELYNGGSAAVDLSGYHLSDNLEQPFRWTFPSGASIPAGGYLLIWADGYDSKPGLSLTRDFYPYASFVTRYYHTNFKLSATGEEVGLFTPGGTRIDGVTYGPDLTGRWYGEKAMDWQQGDLSYGRYPDGGSTWGYFSEPTAGTTNRLPQLAQNLFRAPSAIISPAEPLFINGPVTVTLSSGAGVTAIRYTLDSSQPTSASLLYTNAFTVATNTVVRARAYASGLHPSEVTTRTFLVNQRKPDLPVVSFVIAPLVLTDNVTGIFKNNLKEREVPGSIQFCTTPSNTAFKIDAGFRLFSLNTFLGPQKPFTVYLDGKYGTAEIGYQLFPEKPVGLFDRFVLRNGNDDWAVAFLRDTLGQQMLKGAINNATQGFRPCASYLNGAYYGLINIQEKMDEVFCAKNYGVDLANIDFFENDGTSGDELLDYGTADGWNALVAYLGANSMAVPANYEYVKSLVDIEDLVDYAAGQVYADDTAWAHNRKWWRDRSPGGKWRWCFVDLDRAFNNVNDNRLTDLASNMVVFRELLNNTEFRTYCAQRMMAHLNSSFNTNRILPIIDYEAQRIRSEIIEHAKLYGSKGGISSVSAWDTNIETIRSYARQRPAIAMQQVASYFGGGQTAQVQVDVGGTGHVLANTVPLSNGSTNTLLSGMPVTLTAVPNIGQAFAYWLVTSNQTASTVNLSAAGSVWRYTVPTNGIVGWTSKPFNDSAWAAGPGQLGYGDGDESTVIGAASNLITAAYFRRTVVITNAASLSSLDLNLLRDDGAIVYLNGAEILRSNMPTGLVSIATFASSNITSPTENDYNPFTVSPVTFVEGTNIIAVEIHQSSANYTDLGFDLQAVASRAAGGIHTNFSPVLVMTPDSAAMVTVQAVFTATGASLLPSVVTGNLSLTAAGSPYLATGDVYVPSNTCLSAGPGVTIQMPAAASIYVQGELRLTGSADAPVKVMANTNANARSLINVDLELAVANEVAPRWGCIAFDRSEHVGVFSNVVIRGATVAGADPVKMIAAVSASRSDLSLYGLDIDEVSLPVIAVDGSSFVLQNSRLHVTSIGDALKVSRTPYTLIENCDMFCGVDIIDTDAIDFGGMYGTCVVRNSHFHDFMGPNNDALDLGEGSAGILIESNLIERCFDKAISCGSGSHVTLRHNVIRDVDMGLGLKDQGSYGLVENNTFCNVSHAVSAYEKVIGRGGASATVRNCIVSQAKISPFYNDFMSTVDVSYTLSDTAPVPGTGNVVGDPLFLNTDTGNFGLQTGSPAVDSGDPASAHDPDGSRADMGALPFDWRAGHAVISEIHYHPSVVGQAEYVELTNPGGAPLDLTGYSFSKGITYAFPNGTLLNPGAYLVIASSPYTPYDAPALVWTECTLDNAGDTIQLIDAASNEIDRVAYEPTAPWPTEPDGQGSSLALIHPRWNNALPTSWRASGTPGGTPGGPELAVRGTPTWWLAQWGATDDFDAAATNDWDHDGMANWAEYIAGTQPTNAASVFLMNIAVSEGKSMVTCPTMPTGIEYGGKQRYYTLESRTNLLSDTWSGITGYTDILGFGQTIVYTNRLSGAGFIRANATLR